LSDIYTRAYHPDYPPPGTYAISATNLQALLFDDKGLFAWFLQREPVAQPGYSILVYEVPRLLDTESPPVTVVLGSTQIDRVSPDTFETYWRTNDLRLRWFDATASCVLPAEPDVWYVLPAKSETNPPPCPFWKEAEPMGQVLKRGNGKPLALYRMQTSLNAREKWLAELATDSPLVVSDETSFAPGDAPDLRREVNPPLRFGERLELMGYRMPSDTLNPGSEWQMMTYWQVVMTGGEQLKIFAQLLDDAGNTRAQHDGFDVPVIGWQVGDLLAQQHTLPLPGDLPPGRYWVQFGVYDANTVQRLQVLLDNELVGMRLLLPPLEVR
jgi:hypothetical protein